MQCLNEMSSHIGDQFVSSHNVQSAMQSQYAHGMLNSRDNHNTEKRVEVRSEGETIEVMYGIHVNTVAVSTSVLSYVL